jgi:hypothetical protein
MSVKKNACTEVRWDMSREATMQPGFLLFNPAVYNENKINLYICSNKVNKRLKKAGIFCNKKSNKTHL